MSVVTKFGRNGFEVHHLTPHLDVVVLSRMYSYTYIIETVSVNSWKNKSCYRT